MPPTFPLDILYALFDQRYLTVAALPSVADRNGKILVFDSNGNLQVTAPTTTAIVYQGGSNADTVIKGNASGGTTVVNLPAANAGGANITTVIKDLSDTSGNALRITPASGSVMGGATYDLLNAGEAIRLYPSAADNTWYKI